jgi:hypothetical protein
MLDHVICDRDRPELLNILCGVCTRQQIVPKSMHVENSLDGELVRLYNGGHANVVRGEYKGRPVAVKAVRLNLTSDFGKCLSVNTFAPHAPEFPIDHGVYRNSVERPLRGGTSATRTSYRCSV